MRDFAEYDSKAELFEDACDFLAAIGAELMARGQPLPREWQLCLRPGCEVKASTW
jgi:hypothetical protein